KNLNIWNKALISKHLWHVAMEKDSLWVKWINTYKLKGKSIWEVNEDVNDNWGWRNILRMRHLVRKHMFKKIGDGAKTSMWFDYWSVMGILSEFVTYRDIYDARMSADMIVQEFDGKDDSLVWRRHDGKEFNDDIFDPEEDISENLLNLDKTKDLPPYHDNQSSGNPTPISKPETKSSSSSPTLTSIEESDLIWEEFEAYLARNDDLPFDAESDLLELEYLLNHDPIKDMDSILEDSVDENSLDDNLDDTISEMFTDEHALDYSSPPLWDDYDDDLFYHETVNDDTYDDPFYSKEEKIKDSKIL
ncbi:hypothetical protein Tco_1151004, partial [Tanacetum coccineum]